MTFRGSGPLPVPLLEPPWPPPPLEATAVAKCAAAPSCQQSHCLREPEDAPEPPLMKVWAGPLPACLVFQPWSQAPGLLGLTPAHAAVSSARWPVPTLPLDGYCNRHCNKHGRGHPQGLRSLPVPCLPLLALEPRSLPAPAVGSPSGALSETGRRRGWDQCPAHPVSWCSSAGSVPPPLAAMGRVTGTSPCVPQTWKVGAGARGSRPHRGPPRTSFRHPTPRACSFVSSVSPAPQVGKLRPWRSSWSLA